MSVAYILSVSTVISGVFPVIAALFSYKNLDKVLKIVAAFLLISTLFDWVLEITQILAVHNNLPAIHLFIVISIVFFAAIYYHAFFNLMLKKAVLILSAIALLIVIYNVIFIEGIWEYPSVSNTILSVMLIFFSLAYFYQLLSRQEFIHIEKQGLFWVNAGVLFYFALNIFLFMLFRQIIDAHQEDYYMIHNIVNIIANVLYTVGLLCKPQKST